MEEWKDIKGYEGIYQVSNVGNVRSLVRNRFIRGKIETFRIIRLLTPTDNGNGYRLVGLVKDGYRKNYYIHRLVAEAFIDNPNGYEVVNHLDYKRYNNKVSNLEWCTVSQNVHHAIPHMKKPKPVSSSVLGKGIRYRGNKYEVGICHIYGGRHDDLESAEKARDEIVKKYYG